MVAGDSLWKIAREYGVSVDELKNANNLTSNVIFVGQVLTIPNNRNSKSRAINIHKVIAGDTLYSIAKMYNTTVEEIIELNNMESNRILIGQLLMIP